MKKALTIALAGNANVGKSVIFNQLTGLNQIIGNWPGKTVERAEGTLYYKGYTIHIIDLPGIYSLTTFSLEERVSREYISLEKPDLVINVVDASTLERNLFFTVQLLELESPLIIALNQIDLAEKKGIITDHEKMQNLLRAPVVPTIAIKGVGIEDLLKKAVDVIEQREEARPIAIRYGKEIEEKIEALTEAVLAEKIKTKYPQRWIAIKLLEDDEEIKRLVGADIIKKAGEYAGEIERIHGEQSSVVISSERYDVASRIAREAQKSVPPKKIEFAEALDNTVMHRIWGYPIMLFVLLAVFYAIFTTGNLFSDFLGSSFEAIKPFVKGALGSGFVFKIVWEGLFEGIIAGITIAIPYLFPFYIIFAVLEDLGYIPRAAFLMDNIMHKIGLHGKAFIPMMLGCGCNVPACLGCRIMETKRERFITAFLSTLVPCAARTMVILGLVGAFVGIKWALALYLFNLLIILALSRAAFRVIPGEPVGLIMEMPAYHWPSLKIVAKQSWSKVKDFIYVGFPLIIAGSLAIKILELANLLQTIADIMSPITVSWLGLPSVVGIAFIFGILRKELTLIMLASLLGTTNFAIALTQTQMIVFTIVTMLYIPCIATIAALKKEFGWKKALGITAFEIVFATLVGGIAMRVLAFIA